MKRQVQKIGIKSWAGGDLIELQAEPLKAIDGFFAAYSNCIIQGCEVAKNGASYNVSAGLISLSGVDQDGLPTCKVVPFAGVEGISLPIYLTLSCDVVERAYVDLRVKPIAYDYHATAVSVKPAGVTCIEITAEGGSRFVDAIQNPTHRFVTDAERTKLNGIATGANNYTHPANHPADMITEDATRRFMTDAERTKLSGIAAGATSYTHPTTHPAGMIEEAANRRFVTDTEKNNWNGKAAGGHSHASATTSGAGFMTAAQVVSLNGAVNNIATLKSDVTNIKTDIYGASAALSSLENLIK